jgi:hypothetical protein
MWDLKVSAISSSGISPAIPMDWTAMGTGKHVSRCRVGDAAVKSKEDVM